MHGLEDSTSSKKAHVITPHSGDYLHVHWTCICYWLIRYVCNITTYTIHYVCMCRRIFTESEGETQARERKWKKQASCQYRCITVIWCWSDYITAYLMHVHIHAWLHTSTSRQLFHSYVTVFNTHTHSLRSIKCRVFLTFRRGFVGHIRLITW